MIDLVKDNSANNEIKMLMKQMRKGILCFNRITRKYPNYWAKAMERLKEGNFHLVYVSPERFRSESFATRINTINCKISRFVIDEMHCVSLWGNSFRYEYNHMKDVIQDAKLILLTASAGPNMVKSTVTNLVDKKKASKTIEIRAGIEREELAILRSKDVVENKRLEEIKKQIVKWLTKSDFKKKDKIIIFTAFANKSEKHLDCDKIYNDIIGYAKEIKLKKTEIDYYNGSLDLKTRSDVHRRFSSDDNDEEGGRIRILICTNAFGMGVNIKNIRGVIHVYPPVTIEEYYQEIGRGGRGLEKKEKCESLLLWNEEDDKKALYFKLSTTEAFKLFYEFSLMSTGFLYVKKSSIGIKSLKKLEEFLGEKLKKTKDAKAKMIRYDISDTDIAKNSCKEINNMMQEKHKEKDKNGKHKKIYKDLRLIFYWLNIYTEKKKMNVIIPLKNFKSINNKLINYYQKTLSQMEGNQWLTRSNTNTSNNEAKYKILEDELTDYQLASFYANMASLKTNKNASWKNILV
jgi:superfamily II DNA helicase RecQ